MSRLTLAEVLAEHWAGYARQHRAQLCAAHYRAVRSVLACRTPVLGGQVYHCDNDTCGKPHFAWHSCNHRSCPQCGALEQQTWAARQEAKLLPGVPYYMITFTVPAELRPLCKARPKELHDALLKESAATLQDVLQSKLGGSGGFTSVLHTWTRKMLHHPHVHVIIPALAFDPKTQTLKHPKDKNFLVHGNVPAARFRTRMRIAINALTQQQQPRNGPPVTLTIPQKKALACGKDAKKWITDVKHVGEGKTALRYLARYVNRSAFNAGRLIGYADDGSGDLLLRWTCGQTGRKDVLKLHPHEFIRRWLIHVLPKGFTRIRHYGFQSSAAKKARHTIRRLIGAGAEPAPVLPQKKPFPCECCGTGTLQLTGQIARSYPRRGPPIWKAVEAKKASIPA
jgi:hypothetical protein